MPTTTDAWLVDTNVLLRWAFPEHPDHSLAAGAVETLRRRGGSLCATPQNLIEFWNAATRPAKNNGFGFTIAWADDAARRAEAYFYLLEDSPEVYRTWRRLVVEHGVSGVQVHDARLAAVVRVNGVPNILTFNTRHFTRYPFLTAVNPRDVVAG